MSFFNVISKGVGQGPTIPVFNGLLTGLVSYYPFENSVVDVHGPNSGTDHGTSDVVGKKDRGRGFDGINDSIDSNMTIPDKTQGSVNIWVYDTKGAESVFSRTICADTGGGFFIMRANSIIFDDGRFEINFFDTSNKRIREITAHNLNEWYMLTVTWNSTQVELFKNTVSQGTVLAGALGNNSNNLDFGTNANANYLQGRLDEPCFYDRVLTQANIDFLYNSGPGNFYSSFN